MEEKTGEMEYQTDLSKFFKPLTDTQKATTKEITDELKPIKEGIIDLPNYPGIQLNASDDGKVSIGEGEQLIGNLAMSYLTRRDKNDNKYGFHNKYGKLYIGDKEVTFKGNDFLLGKEFFKGTDGLWELITSKDPMNKYDEEDIYNYERLLDVSNTIFKNNDPRTGSPKIYNYKKWHEIIGPFWKKYFAERTGTGIIIPSDPKALEKRLKLLLASKEAGNTGVRNEIVSICDELKRQGHLKKNSYKKLMSIL